MIDITTMAQASYAPFILADAGPQQGMSGILGNPLLFFPLMIVMMYFLLIRPQRQKQKEQEMTQKALQSGDEVVTIGGAHGIVATVKEKTVIIKFRSGEVEFDRSAIANRRPKSAATE